MYTPTVGGAGGLQRRETVRGPLMSGRCEPPLGGLYGLVRSSHLPSPPGAPVAPLDGASRGSTSGTKGAVWAVPGWQGTPGTPQNHSQFLHHQVVTAPPTTPPHTLPHRHHSGLPARRSSNARRSLSRALSSRPQLQRSIRRKDTQIFKHLDTITPQTDHTSAAAPRSQSVSSALLTNPGNSSFSRQKSEEQTTTVAFSTVVITCPGDELQQRRDSLWEYQTRHRGGGGTTPSSRVYQPETPTRNDSANKTPRAWTVAGLYQPTELKIGSVSPSSSLSSGSECLHLCTPDRLSQSSPPTRGGVSGPGSKMAYRLRPLVDGGGGSRSSMEGFNGEEGWGEGSMIVGSQLGQHADYINQHREDNNNSRFTHLPRITPQYSPISGHDSRGYIRAFSTATRLSPISSSGVATHISDTNSRTAVTSARPVTLNGLATNDNCSITSSSGPAWDLHGWERISGNHDNLLEDGSEEEDAYTDCSEDRRSENGSDCNDDNGSIDERELSPDPEEDLDDDDQQDQKTNTKPTSSSISNLDRQRTLQDAHLNAQDMLIQSMSNETFQVNNNQDKQGSEIANSDHNVETIREDIEQCPSRHSGSPTGSPPAMEPPNTGDTAELVPESATRAKTPEDPLSLPEICSNGLGTRLPTPTEGDDGDIIVGSDHYSDNNEKDRKREHENDQETQELEGVSSIAETSRSLIPLPLTQEPCRRAKTYKRRSYNLRDLTASFRTEMSKHCRSVIDKEEKEWFDDIVRSSRVVDDTSYDSYARRPLPRIKQSKVVARIYNEKPTVEPVPLPPPPPPPPPPPSPPPKVVALKPVQLYSSQTTSHKKVTTKSKSKHSKLKLALSHGR